MLSLATHDNAFSIKFSKLFLVGRITIGITARANVLRNAALYSDYVSVAIQHRSLLIEET